VAKTWLITGSNSGMARAVAEQLLTAGHRVAATARRPERLTLGLSLNVYQPQWPLRQAGPAGFTSRIPQKRTHVVAAEIRHYPASWMETVTQTGIDIEHLLTRHRMARPNTPSHHVDTRHRHLQDERRQPHRGVQDQVAQGMYSAALRPCGSRI
jgi:hypothetical protein